MLTSRIPKAWDLTLKTDPSTLNTLNPQSLCPDLNLGLIGFRAVGFVGFCNFWGDQPQIQLQQILLEGSRHLK